MLTIAKFTGIFFLSIGIFFLFYPTFLKRFILFCKKGINVYIFGGELPIILGVFFMLITEGCRFKKIIFILGLLFFLEGLVILILSKEKIFAFLEKWIRKDTFLRLIGISTFLCGLLIFYSI